MTGSSTSSGRTGATLSITSSSEVGGRFSRFSSVDTESNVDNLSYKKIERPPEIRRDATNHLPRPKPLPSATVGFSFFGAFDFLGDGAILLVSLLASLNK